MQNGITVYCIRHGLTDWNAQSRYQGQEDIAINEIGRQQARRNGEALRAFLPGIAAAYFVSSPLSRARETMRIIREALGLATEDYATDARLLEVHYGAWQGQLLETLKVKDPDALAARRADPFQFRPPGGENYADLMKRTQDWLSTLTRDTVVATHGGITRTLRAHVLNLDPDKILDLEVPQDRVLILRRGEMQWL